MAAVTGPKAAQIFCEQRVVPRKPGLSSPIRTEGLFFLYYDEKEHSFMKEQLEKIRQEALGALDGVKDAGELDALRVRFLGKKGELTGVLKMMGKLSAEERPVMGQVANNVRAAIEEKIETVRTELKEKALEARARGRGHRRDHPRHARAAGPPAPDEQGARRGQGIFISMGSRS